MSQDFLDPELIADFIVESKEHLETIEPNLLDLEKDPGNLALLNEIFRPMHSLKGASGFLALNRINHLAHKSENILDELRKGTMTVTSEIMDVILASTDALRQMIENLETSGSEGDVPTDHIVAQIEAIMNGELLSGAEPVQAEPVQAEPVQAEPAEAQAPVMDTQSVSSNEDSDDIDIPAPQRIGRAAAMSPREWIATLPLKDSVTLTAFGEDHLKDFIEEARENTENITTGLLELEQRPEGDANLVNDLFRYFHNLKGNSGIIGYGELNGLTHEAETLLNRARQGELPTSPELVDLLLVVADSMEALVNSIDPASGTARPFDASELLDRLQQAVAGGPIELPASLAVAAEEEADEVQEFPVEDFVPADEAPADNAPADPIKAIGADRDEDDIEMFRIAVNQQQAIISDALASLQEDSSRKEMQDALFRSLTAIQHSSSFMGYEEPRLQAERTAGLVDQARKSDMDFGLMVDLLRQEASILDDLVLKALSAPAAPASVPEAAPTSEPAPTPEPAPAPAPAPVPEAAPAPAPVAKPAPEPVSAPKQETAPAAKPAQAAPKPAPASVSKPAPAPKAAEGGDKNAGGAPGKATASSSIRVDHEKLDHLMNLIGELLISRNRYAMIAKTLEAGGADVDVSKVAQDLSETTYAMARVSDELQNTVMKVRMVPVASVFSRFPRLVRDLSRKSGKEVELVTEGEETELDKSVVEVINDPLMHIIRNAVDHGIESAEERTAAGKNPVGRVYLRAYHKGNSVAIEVEDDGKGIDPDKMREVAIRKGIITPEEAKNLDDREAVDLIFAPGFSSAEQITDISGRGVGMDVVRTNVKSLKGSVSTSAVVGKGTCFTLSLPLTLAIIEALMIRMGDQMYAIPLDAVSTTTKLESVRLTDVKGRKAVTMRGEVLGIVDLGELLNLRPRQEVLPEFLSVVIIQDNDRRLGLVVDQLLDRQEIVIKSLGTYLSDVRGLSGASILGDGSVVLILDPHEIYMMATSKAI